MPEEAGSQTVSGCVSAEAGAEDHQIPTHAQGNIKQFLSDDSRRYESLLALMACLIWLQALV